MDRLRIELTKKQQKVQKVTETLERVEKEANILHGLCGTILEK